MIYLLTKSAKYYYDAEAIKEAATSDFGRGVIDAKQKYADVIGNQSHSGWMGGDGEFRNKRDVWTIPTEPNKQAHFATFPTELPKTCILAGSKKGDTVLDPFFGSGTTGEMAMRLERCFIGIEINEKYVRDIAEPRVNSVEPLFKDAVAVL